MNKNMFREYDIRGIYPDDINPKVAKTIGHAFASYIDNKEVIIAYDNRISSPVIHKNLIKGLLLGGAEITDLGLCTTPMYYTMKKHLGIQNGIMITASHNPKEYNGFKISFDLIGPAYGDAIFKFRDYVMEGKFNKAKGKIIRYENFYPIYLQKIKESINFGPRKIKVCFDPGNGTGCVILKDILDSFKENIDYEIINGISDGTFPNHHPDPCVPENMKDLQDKVKTEGFDLGIGIDGDADRVGLIDNLGNFIAVDKIMIMIIKMLHNTFKEKKAIMDVKCSKAMMDEMQKLGIPLEVYRTGNSYMNAKISNDNYSYGGEFSGHMWFKDRDSWYGVDDGIYAGLRIMEILSKSQVNLNELFEDIPKYYNTPEIKVPCPDDKKDYVIRRIKEYLIDQDIIFNDVDGIRVDMPDGFAAIRKSNTTPNLTVRFEKKTEEDLEKTKEEYMEIINNILINL